MILICNQCFIKCRQWCRNCRDQKGYSLYTFWPSKRLWKLLSISTFTIHIWHADLVNFTLIQQISMFIQRWVANYSDFASFNSSIFASFTYNVKVFPQVLYIKWRSRHIAEMLKHDYTWPLIKESWVLMLFREFCIGRSKSKSMLYFHKAQLRFEECFIKWHQCLVKCQSLIKYSYTWIFHILQTAQPGIGN